MKIDTDMFSGCSSLEELNIENFADNNIKDISGMFHKCSSLKELNISIFNTDNLENKEGIFSSCPFFIKKKMG